MVFLTKLNELRHAGHGAVFAHDFADDAGGSQAGDAREVHGCFRLTGANEHAALASAQRKNVAGAREVLWFGLRIDGREDGDGAVGSAAAGGDADAVFSCFGKVHATHGSADRRYDRLAMVVSVSLLQCDVRPYA